MRWAVILVTLVLSTHHVVTQRVDQAIQYKALEEFYHATGGPTWKNNSGWLDGPPCGKDWRQIDNRVWHGLICNLENGVTNMNLINVCFYVRVHTVSFGRRCKIGRDETLARV